MSLIIEALKKLKKEKNNSAPIEVMPPGIKKVENKSFKYKKLLITLILTVFLGIISVFGIYFFSLRSIDNKQNYIAYTLNNKNNKQKQKTEKKPKKSANTQKSLKNVYKPSKQPIKIGKAKERKISNLPPPVLKNKEKKNKISEVEINSMIFKAKQYTKLGNYNKALEIYKKLYKLNPNSKILNNLLVLYIRTDNESKILKYLKNIKGKTLYNITIELIKQNKQDFAQNLLNKIPTKDGYYFLSKAILLESLGSIDLATGNYERAYILEKSPLTSYYYARALEIKGKYKKAYYIYKNIYSTIDNEKLKNIIKHRLFILKGFLK